MKTSQSFLHKAGQGHITSLAWQDVGPQEDDGPLDTAHNALKWEIYVWPLQVTRQNGQGKHLVRLPFV